MCEHCDLLILYPILCERIGNSHWQCRWWWRRVWYGLDRPENKWFTFGWWLKLMFFEIIRFFRLCSALRSLSLLHNHLAVWCTVCVSVCVVFFRSPPFNLFYMKWVMVLRITFILLHSERVEKKFGRIFSYVPRFDAQFLFPSLERYFVCFFLFHKYDIYFIFLLLENVYGIFTLMCSIRRFGIYTEVNRFLIFPEKSVFSVPLTSRLLSTLW